MSTIEREQEIRQQLPLAARQPRGRLVEHEDLRLRGQRHAERDLPMLAVRERPTGPASLWSMATRRAASRAWSPNRTVSPGGSTGRRRPPSTPTIAR